MDHHYLPRSYLKNFTDPASHNAGRKMEPYLWLLDAGSGKWERRAPKNVASLPDYYAIKNEGEPPDHEVEKLYSKVESTAAAIIRKKLLKGLPLTEDERISFSYFVGLMATRVPVKTDLFTAMYSEMAKLILETVREQYLLNPHFMKADLEKAGIDPADINPNFLDAANLNITPNRALTLADAVEAGAHLANILLRMCWMFVHSSGADYFITSDSPVMISNRDNCQPDGIMYSTSQVTFPVTRNLALMATHDGPETTIQADYGFVKLVNFYTGNGAVREILAPSPSFPGADMLDANRFKA